MDDHLELPGVADITDCAVVLDRLNALHQTLTHLSAIGESPPFRVDVLVDTVPTHQQPGRIYVDIASRGHVWDGSGHRQGIRATTVIVFLKTTGLTPCQSMGVAGDGDSVSTSAICRQCQVNTSGWARFRDL